MAITQPKKWTVEETQFLKENFNSYTYLDIAKILGREKDGVAAKARSLGCVKNIGGKFWTNQKEQIFIALYEEDFTYKEIAKKLNTTVDKIKRKALELQTNKIIIPRGKGYNNPLADRGGVIPPDQKTLLYFLYFPDEDFYKVGITNRSVKERFYGYPEYLILDVKDTLYKNARQKETFILSKLKLYKYAPTHIKFYRETGGGSGGYTECFKIDNILENFDQLLEFIS